MCEKCLKKILSFLLGLLKVMGIAAVVLFVVYFWNLDQKLMSWAYKRVNTIFDRKKIDQVF